MPWWSVPDKSTGATYTEEMWDKYGRDNGNYLEEVAYAEFTADVNVTATTSATAQLVVSAGAIVFEAVPTIIRFECPFATPAATANAQLVIGIYDNGAANGVARIAQLSTPAAAITRQPVGQEYRFTPTAASHTYEIRAYVSTGSGNISAGVGGNDVVAPGHIRIVRVPV